MDSNEMESRRKLCNSSDVSPMKKTPVVSSKVSDAHSNSSQAELRKAEVRHLNI